MEDKPEHPASAPNPPSGGRPGASEPNPWALAGAGMELAAGVGVLTLLGWWLDKKWSTAPWLLVTGAGLGLIGGMYNLWKQAQRSM